MLTAEGVEAIGNIAKKESNWLFVLEESTKEDEGLTWLNRNDSGSRLQAHGTASPR